MGKDRRLLVLVVLSTAVLLASTLRADVLAVGRLESDTASTNCDPPHHTPAPFLDQMVGNDNARIYANMAQTIIVAMKIAECGYRWFFALYYDGKFHTNFFPEDGWNYIRKQIKNYGLSLITWRNVLVNSVTSITVLSLGFFFPTFIFIPWVNLNRLYGIPEPTVTAVERGQPVRLEDQISPLETPHP